MTCSIYPQSFFIEGPPRQGTVNAATEKNHGFRGKKIANDFHPSVISFITFRLRLYYIEVRSIRSLGRKPADPRLGWQDVRDEVNVLVSRVIR